MNHTMVGVLRREFDYTLQMLKQLVEACSDEMWVNGKQKYWKHILHAAIGIKFWLRQEGEPFAPPDFNKDVTDDFDKECTDFPTKEEIIQYIDDMAKKASEFLDALNDDRLLDPCAVYNKITKADAILGQVRHIQHHVGYCNNILTSGNQTAVKWLGYGD